MKAVSESVLSILGMKNLIYAVREHEQRNLLKKGLWFVSITSGLLSYYFYKKEYNFISKYSEYRHKLLNQPVLNLNKLVAVNINSKHHNLLNSVENKYDEVYKMKTCKLTGYFDHSKEIHIPHIENGIEGYLVFSPFYYVDYVLPEKNLGTKENLGFTEFQPDKFTLKGTMIVDKGW